MVLDDEAPVPGTEYRVRVAGAAELAVGQTRAFSYERAGKVFEGFLLHHATGFVAFANSCPHWNVDLDMGFGDFYDSADDRIFCRNHGALFLPTTGECTAGPCAGLYLERFEVELTGGDAMVDTSPPLSVTNLLRPR